MARYQRRAFGCDGQGAWNGELARPRCGDRTAVRTAQVITEMTDANMAVIAASARDAFVTRLSARLP